MLWAAGLLPIGMMDLGLQVLKVLAVMGAFSLGWGGLGGVVKLCARLLTRGRQVPRPLLFLVQALGGTALGLAVALWVYSSGGSGPGLGGLFGRGTGEGTGKGEAKTTTAG